MISTLIFDGPQNINEINRGLVSLLKADGFNSISEAVGSRNPLPKITPTAADSTTQISQNDELVDSEQKEHVA